MNVSPLCVFYILIAFLPATNIYFEAACLGWLVVLGQHCDQHLSYFIVGRQFLRARRSSIMEDFQASGIRSIRIYDSPESRGSFVQMDCFLLFEMVGTY
jgi:hypothetical protein